MITVFLMGGLGNQLFQIAFCIAYAIRNKKSFFFKYSDTLDIGILRPTYWNNFLKSLKPFTKENIISLNRVNEYQYHYIDFPANLDNIEFFGYFQSYKYFDDQFSNILKFMKIDNFKTTIKNDFKDLLDNNTISLHIRLGDYKYKQDCHPVMPVKYYINSLSHILNINPEYCNSKVIIFSELDDYNIVENDYLKILKNNFTNLEFILIDSNLSDWEQLLIMSCCKNNIIANSSFSWWGAYFNDYNEKIVCYPSEWFGPKLKDKNMKDLFPLLWNKINTK
jgi:hypothetical protein